jgi:hypothetical protein
MNEFFISVSMEIGVMFEAVTSDIEGVFYNMLGTVPRFTARRSYRPRAMFAGVGFLLVCGLIAVALGMQGEGLVAPYIAGAGVLGYFVATIVAMIPQPVTLEIEGTTIRPSWRPEFKREQVVLSSLIAPGVDAAMGVAVEIRGRGGRIRIGGERHDGEGYEITGKPIRSVECQLPKEAFDDLLAAVGVERGPPGPLVVPLIRSTQSFVGIVRGMAPWLFTVTLLGVFGIVLGNTGWGDRLIKSDDGQIVILIVCGALVIVGVGAMIIRGRRIRRPEFELRFERDALIVVETRRHNKPVRVPWEAVTIEKLAYSVSSRYGAFSMPLLVIGTPERKLRLGAWDTGLAWPGDPAKTWRAPHWLVGAAKWPKLVDALKRHNRM